MARLGNAEYPDIGLLECLHTARIVAGDFGGEIQRSGLAHVLDMSPNGGAFAARLSSMRMWGILEGRSTLRLTQAALRTLDDASYADPSSVNLLARNVPLFNQIDARLSAGTVDRAVLAAAVQELTEAPMDDVNGKLPQIERLFNEARRYMHGPNSSGAPATTDGRMQSQPLDDRATYEPLQTGPAAEPAASAHPAATMRLTFDGGEMVMAETADNIDLFITALVTRKRKLLISSDDGVELVDDDVQVRSGL